MPTPIIIDGFEHQVLSLDMFGGTTEGVWATAIDNSGSITFPAGRNGVCIQFAPAGVTTRAIKRVADITTFVTSFYFNTSSSPGVDSDIFFLNTPAFGGVARLQLMTTGKIRFVSVGDSVATYNDGAWHRIDLLANVSANPWTLSWQIDGVAQTGATPASAATSVRYIIFGTSTTDTYTVQFDDFVASGTAGDYPLGIHDVLYGVPNGDGTHAAGVNTIEDNAGTDIVSPNAFPLLDEVPATTADYIQQSTIGGANYAEVTFADQPANKTIWGVEGVAALFASGVNANSGTTRVVDSAGTTLTDIYASDMSETSLHYRRAIITAPGGGWDGAGYTGVKARVGFSGDVTDVPRWAALMLQYAAKDAVSATRILDPMGTMGFFGA